MDVLPKSSAILHYSSHGVWFPSSHGGKSFKGCSVGVDVQVPHGKFHELVVRGLFSPVVLPSRFEGSFKVVPKGFVRFRKVSHVCRVGAFHKFLVTGIHPIFHKGSLNIGQGSEYPVERDTNGVIVFV